METYIHPLIAGICGNREYPTTPSENTPIPYLVYTIFETNPLVSVDGAAGLTNVKVSIDVIAKDLDEVQEIFDDLTAALHCHSDEDIQGSFLTGQETTQGEDFYHGIQNYSVWINT